MCVLFVPGSASAAIGVGGATCTASSKTASTTLACTPSGESFNVGNYAVMVFAGDNLATVEGNDQLLSSVTDEKGNAWTVHRCYTNPGTGSAGTGVTTCIASSKITNELVNTTGNQIIANFSSITAKAMVVREVTVAPGAFLSIVGTPQEEARLSDPTNLTISGLPSSEYLYLRSVGLQRTAPGTWTTTNAGFTTTGCAGTSGGLNNSNIEICGEYLIEGSSTGTSSNPTASADRNAFIFVAFKELVYSFSGSVYRDTGITPATSTRTIKVAIGTSTPSVHATTTNAAGDWEIFPETIDELSAGVPVVVWVDGDANFTAAVFTKLGDGITSVTEVDLYQNYLVIRDEVSAATTTQLSELGFYDSTNDSDIPYAEIGRALFTVKAGVALYVAEGTIFNPEGEVVIEGNAKAGATDGSLYVYGSYIPLATTTLAGNLYIDAGATFLPAPGGTVFNATTTSKFIEVHNGETIGALSFTGVGGGWSIETGATTGDITIATGTVTLPRGLLRVEGDFTQSGTLQNLGGVLEIAQAGRELGVVT